MGGEWMDELTSWLKKLVIPPLGMLAKRAKKKNAQVIGSRMDSLTW